MKKPLEHNCCPGCILLRELRLIYRNVIGPMTNVKRIIIIINTAFVRRTNSVKTFKGAGPGQ